MNDKLIKPPPENLQKIKHKNHRIKNKTQKTIKINKPNNTTIKQITLNNNTITNNNQQPTNPKKKKNTQKKTPKKNMTTTT